MKEHPQRPEPEPTHEPRRLITKLEAWFIGTAITVVCFAIAFAPIPFQSKGIASEPPFDTASWTLRLIPDTIIIHDTVTIYEVAPPLDKPVIRSFHYYHPLPKAPKNIIWGTGEEGVFDISLKVDSSFIDSIELKDSSLPIDTIWGIDIK